MNDPEEILTPAQKKKLLRKMMREKAAQDWKDRPNRGTWTDRVASPTKKEE